MCGLGANGCGTVDGFGLAVIGVCRHIPMQSGSVVVGREGLTVGADRGGIGGSFNLPDGFQRLSSLFRGGENEAFRRSALFLRDHFPAILAILFDGVNIHSLTFT